MPPDVVDISCLRNLHSNLYRGYLMDSCCHEERDRARTSALTRRY